MALDAPTLAWRDPDGVTEYPLTPAALNATGYVATAGVAGLGLPEISIVADPMPRGGTRIRHRQPQPKTFTLPLFMEGSSHGQLLSRWRTLAESFERTRRVGPGAIIVARPDGTRRLLLVEYQAGWDNDPDGGVTHETAAVSLYAPDPYWRAETPTVISRAYASGTGVSFFAPLITITGTQTLGATTANNPGGVEAWPDWTITGPAAQVIVTNNTTGESWTLDPVAHRGTALVAGETVTVTTEPAVITGPSAGAPQGSNWSGALNWVVSGAPAAVLWGLDPGLNDVTFTVLGSGAGTSITAVFYARHGTA